MNLDDIIINFIIQIFWFLLTAITTLIISAIFVAPEKVEKSIELIKSILRLFPRFNAAKFLKCFVIILVIVPMSYASFLNSFNINLLILIALVALGIIFVIILTAEYYFEKVSAQIDNE